MRKIIIIFWILLNINAFAKECEWMDAVFPISRGILLIGIQDAKDEASSSTKPLRIRYMGEELPTQELPKLINNKDALATHVLKCAITVFSHKSSNDEFGKVDISLRSYLMSELLTGDYFSPVFLFDIDNVKIPKHLNEKNWRKGEVDTKAESVWFFAIKHEKIVFYMSIMSSSDAFKKITLDYETETGFKRLTYEIL